jgi:hypothetical protein
MTIEPVPSKAKSTRVSSPKSIPNTAVAANVVALVTGTARDMGVSLKMAKKIAEAERLSKKGREYCQNMRRLSQLLSEERSFWWNFGGDEREDEEEEEEEEDFRDWWSQRSAPRRIKALVAPHTRPMVIIFSMSPPPIVVRSAVPVAKVGFGQLRGRI